MPPRAWKKGLWLATAFTAGHSLSLLLSVMGWVDVPAIWVETAIPLTILITIGGNAWALSRNKTPSQMFKYVEALFFGLIHGLGFSGYLKALIGGSGIALPLAGFNVGLEAAQFLLLAAYWLLLMIFNRLAGGLYMQYFQWATLCALFLPTVVLMAGRFADFFGRMHL
jgi:hypothetical protein